jgi:dTDP-4-dehydrorhamnose 3,5-epimerase
MNRFTISDLPLQGLKRIERLHLGDSRGFLTRIFCAEELAAAGWHKPIAQINQTYTRKSGTVRGLHFQVPPFAEMKLLSCLQGAIWDVVVDLRSDSPTFLQWHAELLSSENRIGLLIPEGFAHGFQTLSDDVTLHYCHSELHQVSAESGLNVMDSRLAISWPLAITEMSDRDKQHPMIDPKFTGITI